MKSCIKYLNILILLSIFIPGKSQFPSPENSSVSGKVLDDSTKYAIPFVHIFNESRRQGYISNADGVFEIPASPGDTLVFSSLGFFPEIVFLTKSHFEQQNTIKLTIRFYEIEEVRVKVFKDYEDFKRQFLALELPNTPADRLRNNLATQSRKVAKQAEYENQVREILEKPGIQLFSASIPILSREERQLKNLSEVLKKEEKQRIISKKYNRDIIYEITHLSEDEITEFMGFCNFDDDYLYYASEYDILVKIEEKFKEYTLWKESGSFYFIDILSSEELIS